MWESIISGLIAVNVLLFLIYMTGSLGIMLTWIPGRTVIISLSLLSATTINEEALLFNVALHIIPVLFLIVFRIGIHNYTGRHPRFPGTDFHPLWSIVWTIATVVLLVAVISLCVIKSSLLFGVIGGCSVLLNIANLQDMPDHIKTTSINITWFYVFVANVVTVSLVVGIAELVKADQELVASIISNIPLVSVMLLAQSTLTSVGTQQTSQHIYMLAYQTWPSMAFISTCFFARSYSFFWTVAMASSVTVLVIVIQFCIIMKKLG